MNSAKKLMGSITLAAMALSLAACNTSGSTRLAGIGAGNGGGGNSGGNGSGGGGSGGGGNGSGTGGGGSGTGSNGGGGTGSGGGSGTGGTGSGGTGSGGSGSGGTGTGGALASLPIGSITGSGGVANTGVLPNVGQAGQASPLAPVLVAAGNAALGLGSAHAGLAQVVNGVAPALEPATDAVTQVLTNTGTALNDGASGKTPLVDGVTKAVAPVATVALGGTTLLGDASGTSLVAVSAGAPATGNGSVVDLHLAKNSPLPAAGNLLGAQVADATLAHPTGTPAVDVQVLSPNSPEAQALGVGVLSNGQVASVTAPALNGATGKLAQVANGVLSKAGGGALPGNGALGVQVANTAVIPASGTPAIAANVLAPNAPSAGALGVGVLSGGKLVSVALPGVTNGAAGAPIANPLTALGTILHH
jgi:hypothetical protein